MFFLDWEIISVTFRKFYFICMGVPHVFTSVNHVCAWYWKKLSNPPPELRLQMVMSTEVLGKGNQRCELLSHLPKLKV